ncbi:hypothetical protein NCAS_0D04570 [Naumovozyma castellii]|uniref:Putative lipase ATG15 n=1 Tax=Naumovozyma castellii TaxID=27288 RepID=G0VEP7_NAUCA|nr:hypothetical protein NCAS_0D04570 [Naumovozyma castellii CBS 4309]CCC70038.1 hypothetical protein NCAS_0D04570 [Naumovozyma castellii CBS 4309]
MTLRQHHITHETRKKRNTHYRILRSCLLFGIFLVILLLALLLATHPSITSQLRFPSREKQSAASNSLGKFKLIQVHRHGVGEDYQWHKSIDVDDEFIFQANKLYQEEVSALGTSSADELWTSHENYSTDSPFSYAFDLKGTTINLKRMVDRDPEMVESYLDFAMRSPRLAAKVELEWQDEDVFAPDVTDKETVISLALMSSNAYVAIPHTGNWRNVSAPWNGSESQNFGWDGDGLRGHVFANEKDNIVVISIKGTSAQGIPGSGVDETTVNDKINDNLLFSCCCARVSYLWTTVCDCYTKSYTCDETCLEKELRRKDRYFSAVTDIYRDVLEQYPTANIWMTGHSLGGALASLIGRTFGLPAVSYEAPGEYLAAKRLHLPFPPGLPAYMEGVWHFGHTADPIFMGTCNGASSSCSLVGYAMETSCHTGRVCVYDVVNDKGWRVNMLNHRIHTVIDKILTDYDEVASCIPPEPCVDCYNWKFTPDTNPDPSSSSKATTSTTLTRTSPATTTTTETDTRTSCVGRNWLGICTEYR